ncbi:hypothetical protein QJQ45_016598 [Haematococcus lacustris]|nr:hypothetical protein QJQ45_016598 [Haematococcus lacustris]
MARYTAFQLLANLFLIMSTSRVFVVAQQVTLNQAGAAGSTAMGLPATNTSAMQVAAILSNVFRDVSSSFAAVATGAPASASPVGAVPTTPSQPVSSNATLDPSIVQLLNQSMAAGMPANVVTAIQKALLQQQQAGSDLGTLQGAARTVASFLSLPATLGTGTNIRDFTARIDQLRALRDSVKTWVWQGAGAAGATAAVWLLRRGVLAADSGQLGLRFVAAFPLAELSFLVAQLALAAAITVLIGAILAIAALGIVVSAQPATNTPQQACPDGPNRAAAIPGLQAALANENNEVGLTNNGVGATIVTRTAGEPHVAPTGYVPDPVSMPVVAWALSNQAMGGLTLLSNVLTGVADGKEMHSSSSGSGSSRRSSRSSRSRSSRSNSTSTEKAYTSANISKCPTSHFTASCGVGSQQPGHGRPHPVGNSERNIAVQACEHGFVYVIADELQLKATKLGLVVALFIHRTATMARYTAFQLLATLFLIMSTSRVFVVAQQVTLNQAGAAGSTAMGLPATNTSAMQVAAILSNVFRDVSSNFAAVATGAPASASPVGAVPTTPSQPVSSNATLDPSIVQLLNQSMTAGMPANVVTAIQKALLQQQQAGSDLGTLQGAARTVASFLSLPATLGTGTNIRDFTARIDQLRALRDSVRTFLGADEYVAITGYLLTAAQLGLQFVAAFPLAQLAFVVAQLALGAAITGLIAAIFYIVGSALAIAASIPGLQTALANRDSAAQLTNNGVGATIPTRSSEESSAMPTPFMPDPLLLDITSKAADIYTLQHQSTGIQLTHRPLSRQPLASTSLTGFRLGNSGLGMEKARSEGFTFIDRTCTRCTERVVDDAMHFIFQCTATSSIREQAEFAMTFQNNNENLHDFMLSPCAPLFVHLAMKCVTESPEPLEGEGGQAA